jgi:quinoprotein glucose dehydrogenase
VFATSLDGRIYAYDEDNGNILWSTQLQRVPEGLPSMYENGGRQYLAVSATGALIDKTKDDTKVPRTYVVFALPKK